jgi:hypothetical protein
LPESTGAPSDEVGKLGILLCYVHRARRLSAPQSELHEIFLAILL